MLNGKFDFEQNGFDWEDLDFDRDFTIDKQNLDLELSELPGIQAKYNKGLAVLKQSKARLHEQVKTLRSELTQKCKEADKKATAPMIEAYYRTDEGFKELNAELKKTEAWIETMESFVYNLQGKRKDLNLLVNLYGQEYFSQMDCPRPINREFEERRAVSTAAMKAVRETNSNPVKLECPIDMRFGANYDEYEDCDTCKIREECREEECRGTHLQ